MTALLDFSREQEQYHARTPHQSCRQTLRARHRFQLHPIGCRHIQLSGFFFPVVIAERSTVQGYNLDSTQPVKLLMEHYTSAAELARMCGTVQIVVKDRRIVRMRGKESANENPPRPLIGLR